MTQCAEALRGADIFLMGDEIVTIQRGVPRIMSPHAFITWVDRHVRCYVFKKDSKKYESMGPELARIVLESADFRSKLRPLHGINPVKMPVWRTERRPAAHDPAVEVTIRTPSRWHDEDEIRAAGVAMWSGMWRTLCRELPLLFPPDLRLEADMALQKLAGKMKQLVPALLAELNQEEQAAA